MEDLKTKIINWLKTKKREDIAYVKEHPELIFSKHKEMNDSRIRDIVIAPDRRIKSVEVTESHGDRLLVLRAFSSNFDTIFIILNPFHNDLEAKYRNKVAVVTGYPSPTK